LPQLPVPGKGKSVFVIQANFFLFFYKVFLLSDRQYYRRLGFRLAGKFGGCDTSLDNPAKFIFSCMGRM
jgi:hypothetical protein